MIETSIENLDDTSVELQKAKDRAFEIERRHNIFLEELAQMLPPCTATEMNIKLQVKELLNIEERLRKAEKDKEDIRRDADTKVTVLMSEIDKLRSEIELQQKQNETLLNRLIVLEEKTKSVQTQNFVVQTFEKLFTKPAPNRPKNRLQRWLQKVGLYA
jgi:chromosome segregation ATPase